MEDKKYMEETYKLQLANVYIQSRNLLDKVGLTAFKMGYQTQKVMQRIRKDHIDTPAYILDEIEKGLYEVTKREVEALLKQTHSGFKEETSYERITKEYQALSCKIDELYTDFKHNHHIYE